MANLYDIEKEILDCIDMETGEIIDEEKLAVLNMEKDKKIENIGLWIKNLKADAEAYKSEKMAFAERQRIAENKVDSLKRYLEKVLNGSKFETEKVKIGFRKSATVECVDVTKVPEIYLTYSEPKLDKTAIKDAIKEGKQTGCILVEHQNVQIK